MSDHAIHEQEDAREYHSSLNVALDGAGFEVFKWLVIGHIAFAAGLLAAAAAHIPNPWIWATPLFGLPFVWRTRDYRLWQKALVLLVLFTAVHWAAVEAAVRVDVDGPPWLPGLAGGAVGAAGALTLCALFGLLRHGAATGIFVLFGILVLALVGSMGVYLRLTTGSNGGGAANEWLQMLKIYTPWQLFFAFVLAHTLRSDD